MPGTPSSPYKCSKHVVVQYKNHLNALLQYTVCVLCNDKFCTIMDTDNISLHLSHCTLGNLEALVVLVSLGHPL